jgi:PGF-CTERM motif
MLKGKSTLVSGLPSDEVYKSLNIWVVTSGYGTENNIENAVVCFKVEKYWLQNKSIDQSSITLNWYNDTKWNPLSINLSGEDDEYLYFTAETPGFSPFAITGKTAANETLTETQSQPNTQVLKQSNVSNATNVEQTPEQTQNPNASGEKSTKTPGFEAVFGIVCLLAVFLHKKK